MEWGFLRCGILYPIFNVAGQETTSPTFIDRILSCFVLINDCEEKIMADSKRQQTEFLFMDMEWNQAPGTEGAEGREAIQIGVVAADSSLSKTKTFSGAIRPSTPEILSVNTLKITHTTAANIMQGKPEEVVLNKFVRRFDSYSYIVVWTRDTYELFRRDMKKYKIPVKKHRVVILQDVLGIVAYNKGKIRFENALICAGVKYEANHLHYSKHDADYLFQLFSKCYRKYVEDTDLEERMVVSETGKIHRENCRYIKDRPVKILLMKPKSSVFKGFTVCKICGTEEIWNRFEWKREKIKSQQRRYCYNAMQYLSLTDENIEKICEYFNVHYRIGRNVVFVRTVFAGWIVCIQEDEVIKLFHENYKVCKNEYLKRSHLKTVEGYHIQKLPSSNFYKVIKYIKKHDDDLVKRLAKKNKVERLLEIV